MTTESLTDPSSPNGSVAAQAARSLARRLRLLRKPGNDGKVRVIVDLAEIHYKPVPACSPDGPQADNSALNAQIEQLQAELARLEVEKNYLEARVAGHRSDFERERDRCDKLLAETLVLTKVAMSARAVTRRHWKVKFRRVEAAGDGDSSSLYVARTHSGQPRRQ